MTTSSFPKLLDRFEVISSDEGFVIHDAEKDSVHYLNQTAAIVLSLCTGTRSIESIAELIKAQFKLASAPSDDVMEVVSKFVSEGLVHWQAEDTPEDGQISQAENI